MRLISSQESVKRGEVSFLAIAETLAAITLVFYLVAHFNTLRWLSYAMCISPLLLLRTEKSTSVGINLFDKAANAIADRLEARELGRLGLLIQVATLPVGATLLALLVRASATIVGIFSQPLITLRAIPGNWARMTFSMDSAHSPEIIPEHPDLNLSQLLDEAAADPAGCVFYPIILLLFVPALLYRWSLKATSIIYAPLVFVVYSTFAEGKDLRVKLQLIKRGDLSRIRAGYGVVAIAAFLVKLLLMMKWQGFAEWWKGHPISEFAAIYVAPNEIPKWQIAEVVNSLLAVSVMLFARQALLRYEVGNPLPEKLVTRALGFLSGCRWVLALYTIACTGYITMREAQNWNWPALGEKWLPWM